MTALHKTNNTGWFRHPAVPILLLVLLNLLVAAFVFNNYGESWDENSIFIYARNTVEAYQTVTGSGEMRPALVGPFNLRFYGPFFFAITHVFANWAHGLFPATDVLHFWHLSYFLSFLLAIISFYFLCLRWTSKAAALGATLLFNTQPLLWGHAFINPKDIPFLAFFLASVTTGLWMADKFETRRRQPQAEPAPRRSLREFWQATPAPQRARLKVATALAALLAMGIAAAPFAIWAEAWARGAQAAGDTSWSFRLLSQLAPNLDSISLDVYLAKLSLRMPAIKGAAIAALLAVLLVLALARIPGLADYWRAKLATMSKRYFHPAMIPAAIVLGLAGALRVIAPAAGALVAMHLLWRVRLRGIPLLLVYFGLAALVTYALWPFLWGGPAAGFQESLRTMADFPNDIGVRFNGQDYRSIALPASYLPILLSIQLTEPLLLLAFAGFGVAILGWRRRQINDPVLLGLVAAWFLAPLAFIVIYRPTMYDNFRQFLFVLPPLFLFAGLALDALAKRLAPVFYSVLLFAALLPGLVGIIQLHPYEYVYYNSLVGGVGGVGRRFELDYWATSFRPAIEYLNTVAPPDAMVFLSGPNHIMRRFGRPDLVAAYETASQQTDLTIYDYAILSTRVDTDQRRFTYGEVIFELGRQGAPFVVVKQLSP